MIDELPRPNAAAATQINDQSILDAAATQDGQQTRRGSFREESEAHVMDVGEVVTVGFQQFGCHGSYSRVSHNYIARNPLQFGGLRLVVAAFARMRAEEFSEAAPIPLVCAANRRVAQAYGRRTRTIERHRTRVLQYRHSAMPAHVGKVSSIGCQQIIDTNVWIIN